MIKKYLSLILDNKYIFFALLLVSLMLLSAYSNTFYSPPVLDDFHSFIEEPLTKINIDSIHNLLLLSHTKFGLGRWLPMITFTWDISTGHGEILQLHLTNFLIHIFCFLSVFFMVYSLIDSRQKTATSNEILPSPFHAAIWVAALWALHPAQTNAVTYLVQRMTSMMTLFYVLSIAFFIQARTIVILKKSLTVKAIFFFIASALFVIMSFLSKENSFMIPITLLLTEIWLFGTDLPLALFRFFRRHKCLAAFIAILVIAKLVQLVPVIVSGYQDRHFTLAQRLLTETRVVLWYISVIFWPNPNRLSLEHHIDISTSLIHPPTTLLSLVCILVLVGWCIRFRHKYPIATYGIIWFFVNLIIESTFVGLELVFEHRMYLPSIGIILAIVLLVYHVVNMHVGVIHQKSLIHIYWCLVAIISAAFTLATFERNEQWSDLIAFHRHDVMAQPLCPRAHANLSVALARVGQYNEAIEEANRAIELGKEHYEEYVVATNTIILSYYESGQIEKAAEVGERLLQSVIPSMNVSSLPSVFKNMARVHYELGELQKSYQAIRESMTYTQALGAGHAVLNQKVEVIQFLNELFQTARQQQIDLGGRPGNASEVPTPIGQVAQLFLDVGDRNTAKDLLQQTLAQTPQDAECSRLLNTMLENERLDRIQEGRENFTDKYLHRPFSRFNASMAIALLVRKSQLPKVFLGLGEYFLDYAVHLHPNSPDAHLLRGWYHYERQESEEAITAAKHAIELDPDYAKAWLGLGFFLAQDGREEASIAAFQKMLALYPGSPDRDKIEKIASTLKSDKRASGAYQLQMGQTSPCSPPLPRQS